MKPGTHNLGASRLARTTIAKVEGDTVTITAFTPAGAKAVTITAEQAQLLQEVLA